MHRPRRMRVMSTRCFNPSSGMRDEVQASHAGFHLFSAYGSPFAVGLVCIPFLGLMAARADYCLIQLPIGQYLKPRLCTHHVLLQGLLHGVVFDLKPVLKFTSDHHGLLARHGLLSYCSRR